MRCVEDVDVDEAERLRGDGPSDEVEVGDFCSLTVVSCWIGGEPEGPEALVPVLMGDILASDAGVLPVGGVSENAAKVISLSGGVADLTVSFKAAVSLLLIALSLTKLGSFVTLLSKSGVSSSRGS